MAGCHSYLVEGDAIVDWLRLNSMLLNEIHDINRSVQGGMAAAMVHHRRRFYVCVGSAFEASTGGVVATSFLSESRSCTIELRREMSGAGSRSLRASIMAAIGNGGQHVVVDCLGWERLDLVVLSTLVQGAKACAALGTTFELANLAGQVRDDIVALRLDRRLGLVT